MSRTIIPTNVELFFDPNDIIVSKTDLKGRMTYVNRTFCEIAGYSEPELLGTPHSIIRHPDMPRAVFKLLWDTILEGPRNLRLRQEHGEGRRLLLGVRSCHTVIRCAGSNHRISLQSPRPRSHGREDRITPLYADLLRVEQSHRNGKDALAAGYQHLIDFVAARKVAYDELVFSL